MEPYIVTQNKAFKSVNIEGFIACNLRLIYSRHVECCCLLERMSSVENKGV